MTQMRRSAVVWIRAMEDRTMRLIERRGHIEIWQVGNEFFVYGVTVGGDPCIVPSLAMAREIAA